MGYSSDPDPRRGPRRYGPSSAGPSGAPRPAGTPRSSNPSGRPHQPPYQDRPAGSPYQNDPAGPTFQDGPVQPPYQDRPPYQDQPPYQDRPPYQDQPRYQDQPPYQDRPAGQSGAGRRGWSQTSRPTTKFPAYDDPASPRSAGSNRPGGSPPRPPRGPTPPSDGGRSQPRRRTPGVKLAARIVSVVVAAALLAGVGVAWAFTNVLQGNSGTSDAVTDAGSAGVLFDSGTTILLVGSDARTDADGKPLSAAELTQVGTEADGGGINTDTMMLVHVPDGGGKATAVSLPRDAWIGQRVTDQITGPYGDGTEGPYQPNKINSFYSTAKAYTEQQLVAQGVTDAAQRERRSNEAGRTMLIRVVQAFTGMRIDHYAEVNLLGFYLLSNAIGGVPVCLNAAVKDPWSGADFPAGAQEVQGTAALAFVRQRHGLPAGDLDRVRRQQAFLAGAVGKILSVRTLASPSTLSDLVSAVNRSVIFDKGFSVLSFAEQMAALSSGNINFDTLPTTGSEPSTNKDALATDPAQLRTFFQTISGGTADAGPRGSAAPTATVNPASVTVDVKDGTVADGVTAFAAETVHKGGFALGSLGVVPGTAKGSEQARTEVHYPANGRAAAQQVRDAFGIGKLVEDDVVTSGHVLVIVGTDLPVPSGLRTAGAAFGPATAGSSIHSLAGDAETGARSVVAARAATSVAASVPCVN